MNDDKGGITGECEQCEEVGSLVNCDICGCEVCPDCLYITDDGDLCETCAEGKE